MTDRPTLRAGVARSDITTEEPGIAIHDPLYARALVLDNGQTTLAIVAMDVVALAMICDVPDDFMDNLRARLEGELGIPGANVLVNASHTHPPGKILVDPPEQVSRTFDAVKRAMEDMVPVKFGVGSGYEDRFAINRTMLLKNGKGWTIRHANPCPPDDEIAAVRPIDPEIGVLRFDRLDGRPFAVIFNYACHPLMGFNGGAITANYPGFAGKVIEDNLGEGVMALFLQGTGGDVCDVLYKEVHNPRDVRPFGRMLGLSTLEALRNIETGPAELRVINEPLDLPRRTDIPDRIAELEQERDELVATLRNTSINFRTFLPLYVKYALNPDYPTDYAYRYMHAEMREDEEFVELDAHNRHLLDRYLSNLYAMEKIVRINERIATSKSHLAINEAAGEPTIRTEVQGMRIGDCVLISCPAEVLVQVGLNIKAASPYEHTFVSAFSNGYTHYGPPASDYALGGYEVTECFLAPEWQALWEAKALDIIGRL